MTVKRFDCFEDKWCSRIITDNGKCMGAETVVKILNELHEEVQAQSIVIKGYQERNDKLFKENKQLKKEIEEKEEVIKFYHRFNRGANDDL